MADHKTNTNPLPAQPQGQLPPPGNINHPRRSLMFRFGPCLQQAGLASSTQELCRQRGGSCPLQTSSQAA